ncbi:hypothetical protein [Egbenema bharatensis]|uniref:hypothetical protein n=1 Tax=Egbenema bharatensis TaxID=3463334 RepID=UPI003A888287
MGVNHSIRSLRSMTHWQARCLRYNSPESHTGDSPLPTPHSPFPPPHSPLLTPHSL